MKKFIIKDTYTSADWHDMARVIDQMKENDSYEIINPKEYIAKDMLAKIKNLKGNITLEDIINFMENGGTIQNTVSETEEKEGVTVLYPSRFVIEKGKEDFYVLNMEYDTFDYTYNIIYRIRYIEDNDIAYLVSEHIVNPGKGCDLTERCYHELFSNLQDAEQYLKAAKQTEPEYYRSESGFKIQVVSRKRIENTIWYKDNLEVVRLCEELGENINDYHNYVHASAILNVLQAKINEK